MVDRNSVMGGIMNQQEIVRIWEEDVVIPTYLVGEPDKNPMFLEKRVYQGSTGKVYPLPVIEKTHDELVDKTYRAVYLENEYLKIMILPELGGRIQRAYDKTNQYDFVYYNEVIKPALVGLTGPWISGGIEFNWPQHHRPTTFSPVQYTLEENHDGSKTLIVSETDVMYGTKNIARFTLYQGKAYLEIKGQLYNKTSIPQTFLWWANPAVAVNEHTYSVFPPDVHAVYDHGKRDVSTFPIATGTYYKMDYSKGVDISRYKNIPVPTSYMAYQSNYDFVGGYDEEKKAGLLHIADHHISPGKKQWTWGCGDFGKAWDKNLTDKNGPYIELMTGVYTENQPDFTWLKPMEEKEFTQYFLPYKEVGMVKSAQICGALGVEYTDDSHHTEITCTLYMTSEYENLSLRVYEDNRLIWKREIQKLSPLITYKESFSVEFKSELNKTKKEGIEKESTDYLKNLYVQLLNDKGEVLLSYAPEQGEEEIPEPAKPVLEPEKVEDLEELYLIGMHLEQYRHATYEPEAYYLEGLRRSPKDIRLNTAYGTLLFRRGLWSEAKNYFTTAIDQLMKYNKNPYDSEAIYLKGICCFYEDSYEEAYALFRKAAWSKEQQENSLYYASAILTREGEYKKALQLVEQALVFNSHNQKARGLKATLLRYLGNYKLAKEYISDTLEIDPFEYRSLFELYLIYKESNNILDDNTLKGSNEVLDDFLRKISFVPNLYLELAYDYAETGCNVEALNVLSSYNMDHPMVLYSSAYFSYQLLDIDKMNEYLLRAAACSSDYCFPNKLYEKKILTFVTNQNEADAKAWYYLGILWYDKKQYEQAKVCYEKSIELDDTFPTVHRNLALYYFNKVHDGDRAKALMEKAFACDNSDARILLELDQLYKKLNVDFKNRLSLLENYTEIVEKRDDLYIEYITLLNLAGRDEEAYNCLLQHHFHPWEGGEGKVTEQYVFSLLQMAKRTLYNEKATVEEFKSAVILLQKAKVYPENLGEGKLMQATDNHIDYYLGCLYERIGDKEKAKQCYQEAAIGKFELGTAMYYNDQPADRYLFYGLAKQKLGDINDANQIFHQLCDFGLSHSEDEVKIDYFAVSLPDFLIFDDDLTKRNQIHSIYLRALGAVGLKDYDTARKFYRNILEKECAHLGVHLYHDLFYSLGNIND